MTTNQRHHYIPKFYLKQWVENGSLCEFSLQHGRVKPRKVPPKATGFLRGLNTFARLEPRLATFLEDRFFRTVDNDAAKVLEMLLRHELDFNDPQTSRSAWARFLMSLLHRNPEGMTRIGQKVTEEFPTLLETVVRERYESTRAATDPPTFAEFKAQISQKERDTVHLMVMSRVMNSENVGTLLIRMQWGVIRFNESHHRLMTSDRPICMTPGLARPDAVLIIPISPRQIFVAAHDVEMVRHIGGLAEAAGLAQRLNNAVARQARSYVYSVDDVPLDFVKGRLGDRLQWCPWE
jgi:hypothetical protein